MRSTDEIIDKTASRWLYLYKASQVKWSVRLE